MKVTAKQDLFSHGLRVAGRAVATRSPLPITTNVLLASADGRLRLSATNLDIAISTWIDASVTEEGSITLPAKLLTEFVDTLPAEPIDLTVKQGSHSAHLAAGRYQATIRGMDANDFPVIPDVQGEPAAAIDPALLKEMIEQVAFAAAGDDTRPVLTGVLATFSGDELTLAATNGFRLAVRNGKLSEAATGDFSVIVPARTLVELAKIVPDSEEPVEMTVTPNRNQVVFRARDLHVVSSLLEGQFPNYRQIIPSKFATKVVVSTAELLKATKIASFFARDNTNPIGLEVQPGGEAGMGSIVVSGQAAELGEDRGEIDAVVNGGNAKIQFNARYVSDALNAMQSPQVGIEISGPNSAAVFRPIDGGDYLHIIMPMYVAGGR
ncbi:MAG: DNA polymerase III subunit beta [Chloroflexota bacterium]